MRALICRYVTSFSSATKEECAENSTLSAPCRPFALALSALVWGVKTGEKCRACVKLVLANVIAYLLKIHQTLRGEFMLTTLIGLCFMDKITGIQNGIIMNMVLRLIHQSYAKTLYFNCYLLASLIVYNLSILREQ